MSTVLVVSITTTIITPLSYLLLGHNLKLVAMIPVYAGPVRNLRNVVAVTLSV